METIKLLLNVVRMISDQLGIKFEFVNMGGGLGIPYHPEDQPVDLAQLSAGVIAEMEAFKAERKYQPALYMECGRYVTGPHGVFVTRCINRKSGYREFAGVDSAAISAMMRPPLYHSTGGGWHQITVHDALGRQKNGSRGLREISVVGPACEDNDRFCWNRPLPEIEEGDLIIIHDDGAHSPAMGSNYNGRLRPQELLLRSHVAVELIRRAETHQDLFATLDFEPKSQYAGFKFFRTA